MRVRYITGNDGCVDPHDRGLAYGDGLFETIAVRRGRAERLALHLDRLRVGCDRLSIPLPDLDDLASRITTATLAIDSGHLKLILTRGTGPRGYAPPEAPTPTLILLTETLTRAPTPEIKVAILKQRLGENVKLAGIKHLNRLEQILGRLELADLDADEGLMLSTGGLVIGGTSRNLFARYGDRLRTPLIERAGVAGVMRRVVLEQCAELRIDAREGELHPDELVNADEIFMTNALVGIQSVVALDGRSFDSTAMASRLRDAILEAGGETSRA